MANNDRKLLTDNLGVQQYLIQIEGQNLYVTKCHVKHTFSLQRFLLENGEFLRFEFCEFSQFIITNCTLANRSTKLLLISDPCELGKNLANSISIKPISLIQQNEKLRMSKLNKSVSKSFSFVSQSNGKLNFQWGKQNADSKENACLKQSVKVQNRTSSISRASDIKANNSKKNMQKKIRQDPKNLNKSMENFSESIKGSFYQQKNRNYLNSTKKSKLINCSYAQPKRQKSEAKLLESSMKLKEPIGDELSSSSRYTSKKEIKKQGVPVRACTSKALNTVNKQNKSSENSFNCSSMKKQNYTEFKSSILNNVNLSTSVRMGPKVFGKNICQAKIAQVSRPLLQLKE